ncbi:MAG: zinc-binding alcohol dehydrogenase [Opitutaceae bacterium]
MKSKAVVFTEPGKVAFLDVECPEPGPGDVVIELTHSWISNGTEGSFLRGERIEGDVAYRPGDPWPFPIVAGYQKVGRITWLGSEVQGFSIGQTVFAVMSRIKGMFDRNGGHISPSVCAASQVFALPEGIDPVAFSGLVLTQVGYNCAMRPRLEAGQTAVVVGDGLVGLWAAQALIARGAFVVLVGRHDDRLARLRTEERHLKIKSRSGTGAMQVREAVEGPVEVLVDTVGSIGILNDYLPMMRRGGTIVSAGFYGTSDRIPLQHFRNQEISFDLVSGMTRERLEATLDFLAAGKMETLPLITHRFPVARAADAWALIRSRRDNVLGVVLEW